ncbi:MAG: hypothetical protein ACT443_03625 [Gemmatimonadota bacterium]
MRTVRACILLVIGTVDVQVVVAAVDRGQGADAILHHRLPQRRAIDQRRRRIILVAGQLGRIVLLAVQHEPIFDRHEKSRGIGAQQLFQLAIYRRPPAIDVRMLER